MKITVDVSKVRRAHARFKKDLQSTVDQSLAEAGTYAQSHVKNQSEFSRQSARSVKDATKASKVMRTAGGRLIRITNSKMRGGYDVSVGLEHGTKAHAIEARNARTLRFTSNGQVFFRKRAWHPGTKPYKFLFKAVDAAHKFEYVRLKSRLEALARKF